MNTKEKFQSILTPFGFKLVEDKKLQYFGDYYTIYEKGNVRLRLCCSKSYEYIEIGNKQDNEEWFEFAIVKPYLLNNHEFGAMSIEESLAFMQNNLNLLIQRFESAEYAKTKEELSALRKLRAQQRFQPKK